MLVGGVLLLVSRRARSTERREAAAKAVAKPAGPAPETADTPEQLIEQMRVPTLEILPLVGILGVLWYGGHRVIAGDISLGTFALFNFYLAQLVWPLRNIVPRASSWRAAPPWRRRATAFHPGSASRLSWACRPCHRSWACRRSPSASQRRRRTSPC